MKFDHYKIEKGNIVADTIFIPQENLTDIHISTPFTFPIYKNRYVLAKDKMGWWNPLGGHIDINETWEQALIREAYEEAGVKIKDIKIFGYIKISKLLNHPDNKYPDLTQIPMTISKAIEVDYNWVNMETSGRIIADEETAKKLLSQRTDNMQMLQIFEYLTTKVI
ncbi:MAG: NUDIX domain-containing protein [Patescibacteria group bacterium]